MYSKNLFIKENPKTKLGDFFQKYMPHLKKENKKTQQKQKVVNIQMHIQKTKTLKKSKYFQENIPCLSQEQKISQKKSQSSISSSVLGQLACYMQEKKSQIPWTKKFDWQDFFTSSQEKSQQKSQSRENIKQFTFTANKHYKNKQNQESFSRTVSIKKSINNSSQTQKCFSIKNSQKSSNSSLNTTQLMMIKDKVQNRKQMRDQQIKSPLNVNKDKKYNKEQNQLTCLKRQLQSVQKEQNNKYNSQQESFKISKNQRYYDFEDFSQNKSSSNICLSNYKFENTHKGLKKQCIMGIDISISNKKSFLNRKINQDSKISDLKDRNSNNFNRVSEYKPKRLKKAKDQETTCSICIDQIQQRVKLPCKHSFCRQCLLAWIQKNSNCPNCRVDAQYYTYDGQKYEIQQKQFQLENYVNNIGGDEDSDQEHSLDYECYNCDQTNEGDQLLICDGCFVSAAHVECDPALRGKAPPQNRSWYCHICRRSPNQWHHQKYQSQLDDY